MPAERSTWVVRIGGGSSGIRTNRATQEIDNALAEIEAAGWQLQQVIPDTHGSLSGGSGFLETIIMGVFRRAT